MEKIQHPTLIIVPDDYKLKPFILEMLEARGLPVKGYTGIPPYELARMNPDMWNHGGYLCVELKTRREFASIPIILEWAEKAQVDIYLCGYMYGEGFPGSQTTKLVKAGEPAFWEGLARAQWWFEKEAA